MENRNSSFEIQGLGSGFRIWDNRLQIQSFGFCAPGLGLKVQSIGIRVSGFALSGGVGEGLRKVLRQVFEVQPGPWLRGEGDALRCPH